MNKNTNPIGGLNIHIYEENMSTETSKGLPLRLWMLQQAKGNSPLNQCTFKWTDILSGMFLKVLSYLFQMEYLFIFPFHWPNSEITTILMRTLWKSIWKPYRYGQPYKNPLIQRSRYWEICSTSNFQYNASNEWSGRQIF